MNYYERHLGDYARDTAHLSLLEHGAYTLLLDRYYATEAPIPADQAHRVARARSADEKAAVDAVLAEFFTLVDGAYQQKRVQAEIEHARARIEAARTNGRNGGRPKKNPAGFGIKTQQEPSGFPVGSKTETQTEPSRKLSRLQSPDSNLQTPEREEASAQKPNETQRVFVSRGTSASQANEAWTGVEGIDEQAMRDWMDHRSAKGKPLTPLESIAAAKMLAGMGAAERQRAAVLTARGNGWMNLRLTDGAPEPRGVLRPVRGSSGGSRITWAPEDYDPKSEAVGSA